MPLTEEKIQKPQCSDLNPWTERDADCRTKRTDQHTKSRSSFASHRGEFDLKADEFISFRDYIHQKSGLFFAENKIYLVRNRLENRMNKLGLSNFIDYFHLLKYSSNQNEFNSLMNVLTTNETSFFRNTPQIQVFADEVLPLLLKAKKKSGNNSIRIWSAGCSTGEEPYTLAMVLKEKVPNLHNYKVEILANDISLDVLKAAGRGIYNKLSLRTTPNFYKTRYFVKKEDVFHLDTAIKSMVNFSHINMIDRVKMSLVKNMDIIFCRNVSIYFSEEVKKIVTRQFYDSLAGSGYYFIGHSESLHGITKAFKLVYFKNGLVYQKD